MALPLCSASPLVSALPSSVRTANQAGRPALQSLHSIRRIGRAARSSPSPSLRARRATQAPRPVRAGATALRPQGTLISGCSLLFALSCAQSPSSSPTRARRCRRALRLQRAGSGRVATSREIALGVHLRLYRRHGKRLGVTARSGRRAIGSRLPVCAARVLLGAACSPAIALLLRERLWCLWRSRGAGMRPSCAPLEAARRRRDTPVCCSARSASSSCLVHEIPPSSSPRSPGTAPSSALGVWECVEDAGSPLWLKRLPFFFIYFFGCSWLSRSSRRAT